MPARATSIRPILVLALFLLACVLTLAAWYGSGTRRPGGAPLRSIDVAESATLNSQAIQSSATTIEALREEQRGSRNSIPARVRIVDEQGRAVVGASLSWTRLAGTHDITSWPWIDDAGRFALRVTVMSDTAGEITEVPALESGAGPSIVWITHPEFAAVSFLLAEAEVIDSLPDPIQLLSAPGIDVTVVDADGRPAANADVHQRLEHPYDQRTRFTKDESSARLCLWRTARTDSFGRARIASLPARQFVHASTEVQTSRPWRGIAPDMTTLTLAPTVACRGFVSVDDPTLDLTRSKIEAFAWIDARRALIGATRIERGGSLVQFSIPALKAERYEFELSGGSCVPMSVIVPTPTPGSLVTVEFQGRRGHSYPVRVVDAASSPVAGATVAWAWQSGKEWTWWSEGTVADGTCTANAIPFGPTWLEITKEGFQTYKAEFDFQQEFSPAAEIVIERAGSLQGMVTGDGKPVANFVIVIAPARDYGYSNLREHPVNDSKDGRYSIESVPIGEIAAFAYSEMQPRTATKLLEIGVDRPTTSDFELTAPRTAVGCVRDASTSRPIVGAIVQGWVSADFARVKPWGAASTTGIDGAFRVDALSSTVGSQLRVEAEGYSTEFVHVIAGTASPVDVGIVSLGRPQPLEVRIQVEDGLSPTTFSASLRGATTAPRRAFDQNGHVVFEGLPNGRYVVTVQRADDWWHDGEVQLSSTRPTRVAFDFRRVRALAVAVEGPSALPTDAIMEVVYSSRSTGSPMRLGSFVRAENPIDVGFLDGRCFHVDVLTMHERILASARIQNPDEVGPILRIALGGPDRRIRVVSASGVPMPYVTVAVAEDDAAWSRTLNSDSQGTVVLTAFAVDLVNIFLLKSDVGFSLMPRIRLRDDVTELVFDPDAKPTVHVSDGNLPLSGVTVRIKDTRFGQVLGTPTTSADGDAIAMPISAGEYELEVDQVGLWPAGKRVQVPTGSTRLNLQVRRLGSAVLNAKRGGLALAQLPIRVTSEEFGVDVTKWTRPEKPFSMTPSDGRTDSAGVLTLDALPCGAYRWTVESSDGVAVAGRFEVEPATRIDVDVLLP